MSRFCVFTISLYNLSKESLEKLETFSTALNNEIESFSIFLKVWLAVSYCICKR